MAAELPEQAGEIRIIPFPRPAASTQSVHAEPARSCSQQIKLRTTLGAIGAPRRSRPPRAGAASPCEVVLSIAAFRPSTCQRAQMREHDWKPKPCETSPLARKRRRLQPMNGCRPSFIVCQSARMNSKPTIGKLSGAARVERREFPSWHPWHPLPGGEIRERARALACRFVCAWHACNCCMSTRARYLQRACNCCMSTRARYLPRVGRHGGCVRVISVPSHRTCSTCAEHKGVE